MSRTTLACVLSIALLVLAAVATPSWAQLNTQIDISGNWSPDLSADIGNDPPSDPLPGWWAGLPLNASGRAKAMSYSELQLSEPALTCDYAPGYLMFGPFGLRIWDQTESSNGTTVAWHVGGWEDRPPLTIWMDGRLPPSDDAPHTKSGFASGSWVDGMLVAHVIDMQAGMIRRNGAPLSDKASMTLWFIRHGNELTLVARISDPVYLSQPFVTVRDFVSYVGRPELSVGPPCVQENEGVSEDHHPFFLPGQNPTYRIGSTVYGVPLQVALGGARTMYPEIRKELKRSYRRPSSCHAYAKYKRFPDQACGGPGRLFRFGPRN